LAEASIYCSTEQGFSYWLAEAIILKGCAMAYGRQVDEGLALMNEGLAAYRATGAKLWRLYYLALMSETLGNVRRPDDGLALLAEALDLVRSTSEHEHEAELHRLRGELILKQERTGNSESTLQKEAEDCFRRAVAIATEQTARSLELRATTSLARLLVKQDRRDEAHTMLAEIYNWFTEGFDTADLKDAKALLDELSA
jgi:predicted ATPase